MTTAQARPAAVEPPRGSREAFRAPGPVPCPHCEGCRVEPDEEAGEIPCLACNGSGVGAAEFDLPRTRAYAVRRVAYAPACVASGHWNALAVATAQKESHRRAVARYAVVEVETPWPGRAFCVAKAGADRRHNVYLGPDGVRCDCEASTYLTTAKCNQKAHDEGEAVYAGYGCVHADALAALLLAGWFDL